MTLLDRVIEWEERLAVRRSAVLFVTLWMTWRSFAWATVYAESVLRGSPNNEGALGAAALIAAVTAPIGMLQTAVFKAYIESKPTS